jgi:hypothetical protein
MKHEFHVFPVVPSICALGSEEGNLPRRTLLNGKRAAFHTDLALRSERSKMSAQGSEFSRHERPANSVLNSQFAKLV